MRETPMVMQQLQKTAVFVHGAGGGGWEWNVWRRVFAANGWHCSAPDLQPAPAGLVATRLVDYVDQVVAAAKASAVPPVPHQTPVLIGASLGGLLALAAGTRVAVAALVLINPLPASGHADSVDEGDADGIVPWRSQRKLASTLRALPDADDAARLFAFRHWRDESAAVLREARRGIATRVPSCPILVLASEHDADAPLATSLELAVSLGAESRVLRGASHVGPLLGRRGSVYAEETLVWLRRALIAAT
jgi:pimeloyl-ACP methyl ester carboxylesterase